MNSINNISSTSSTTKLEYFSDLSVTLYKVDKNAKVYVKTPWKEEYSFLTSRNQVETYFSLPFPINFNTEGTYHVYVSPDGSIGSNPPCDLNNYKSVLLDVSTLFDISDNKVKYPLDQNGDINATVLLDNINGVLEITSNLSAGGTLKYYATIDKNQPDYNVKTNTIYSNSRIKFTYKGVNENILLTKPVYISKTNSSGKKRYRFYEVIQLSNGTLVELKFNIYK